MYDGVSQVVDRLRRKAFKHCLSRRTKQPRFSRRPLKRASRPVDVQPVSLLALVELLELVMFSAVAAVAFVRWRRHGGSSAAWLFATFAVLAVIVPLGWATGPEASGTLIDVLRRLVIVLLALFPYFLYRFTSTFWVSRRRRSRCAGRATTAIVLLTLLLPRVSPDNGSLPWWYALYAVAFVVVWSALSLVSASRLWRCGRDEPSVTRSRMRTLGLAAVVLNLALLIVAATSVDQSSYVTAAAQCAGLASGLLFLMGFAPPPVLRSLWRRDEVAAFRAAEEALMQAGSADEVASIMLPHAVHLVGGRGAVLVDGDHQIRAKRGMGELEAALVAQGLPSASDDRPSSFVADDLVAIPLGTGWLAVTTTASTPFFGTEELHLVQTLGHLAGLALERAELSDRERFASRELAEREWQLAEAQRTAHMGSYTWDLTTGAVVWSDEMRRILGFGADEDVRPATGFASRVHPEDRDRVIAAWRAARETPHPTSIRYRIVRSGGATRWVEGRVRPILDRAGAVVRAVGTLQDITDQKEIEESLAFQATHDALTLLPNRVLLFDRLTQALARRARHSSGLAVIFLDIDGLKEVNDRLGHVAADEVLVAVAHRWRAVLRPEDTLARFGGDEFVMLCEDLPDAAAVAAVAARMAGALVAPISIEDQDVTVTVSTGIAFAPGGSSGETLDSLLREADAAMYRAKHRGRNGVEIVGTAATALAAPRGI